MLKFLRKHIEHFIYLFFWLMVYLIPILMMYIRARTHVDEEFEWMEIFHTWRLSSIFLVIFIIHNYFLAPLLVYKNNRKLYFSIVTVIVIGFGVYQFTLKPKPMHKHKPRLEMVQSGKGDYPPPPEKRHHRPFFVDQADFISVIVLIMMLGMNLGIKLLLKQDEDSKKLQELKSENLHQQLEYLKYQINPHFFMNTLNNIHALVDIDPEEAKESIIELSKLMRYVLYDGNRPMVSLSKEKNFIDNYIELMRLRYSDQVDIKVETDEPIPEALIAPLITITYVENAFKHGVSYEKKSFIHIASHFKDGRFVFTCSNSKHKKSTVEHGGVGLENTRKRLDLIYGSDYSLDITEDEDTYNVRLDIPLRSSLPDSEA